MSYDFAGASDFLRDEAQTTPEGLYNEVCGALQTALGVSSKNNSVRVQHLIQVLLTCADFLQLIEEK